MASGVSGGRLFESPGQPQDLVHHRREIRSMGVNTELGMERFLVGQGDVGSGRQHSTFGGSRAQEPPARGLLPLPADLGRTHELNFGEVSDPLARNIPPRSSGRGRIEDHDHSRFGEQLGGEREGPVDEGFLSLARPVAPDDRAPGSAEIENLDGYRGRRENVSDSSSERRLPAAGSA